MPTERARGGRGGGRGNPSFFPSSSSVSPALALFGQLYRRGVCTCREDGSASVRGAGEGHLGVSRRWCSTPASAPINGGTPPSPFFFRTEEGNISRFHPQRTPLGVGACLPVAQAGRGQGGKKTPRARSPLVLPQMAGSSPSYSCAQDAGAYAGCNRPVLKHGPRSLTCVRVLWWHKPERAAKAKRAVHPVSEVGSASF